MPRRFPITVYLVESLTVVYRGCHGDSQEALTEAMRSNYEAQRPPHPSDLKATVLHMALSTFDDAGRLLPFARMRPDRVGSHIARLELRPGSGICFADTGSDGHFSVWGRADVLAAHVVSVEAVDQ